MAQEPNEDNQAAKVVKDREGEVRSRKMKGPYEFAFGILAMAFVAFHLYTAGFGSINSFKQKAVHLGFVLPIIFLVCPSRRKGAIGQPSIFDVILACLGAGISIYAFFGIDLVNLRGGACTTLDLIVGWISILMVLEGARRSIGWELVIVASTFVLYTLYGNYIPGMFGHRGFTFATLSSQMYLSSDGIFGIPLGVSATYVVIFIIFGAFLGETGAGTFINDISLSLAGRTPGGPAKVAVVASGLMGTINGSAVANVLTTGTFTIPLMKKIGYRASFAGAVEAVASTGGQIAPPIMGAAAFVMAEFLRTSYLNVMIAAIIPATLYFFSVFAQVHLRAKVRDLKGLPKESLPIAMDVIKARGHAVIPVIVLVLMLLKYTPMYAAFWAIIVAFLVGLLRPATRTTVPRIYAALCSGVKAVASVASASAVVGLVIGAVGLTGIGATLADNVLQLARGNLVLILLFTAMAAIVLGMGVPTAACYIIASVVTVPIIIKAGVPEFPAHFFVFYFAVLSMVTPPVALAAYAASGLCGAGPSEVGWAAFKLAIAGFIIPFVIVFAPDILIIGSKSVLATVWVAGTTFMGIVALAACVEGYLFCPARKWERAIFLCAALLLIKPGGTTDTVGFILFGAALISQLLRKQSFKKSKKGS